jgi:hypothetical protein
MEACDSVKDLEEQKVTLMHEDHSNGKPFMSVSDKNGFIAFYAGGAVDKCQEVEVRQQTASLSILQASTIQASTIQASTKISST